MINGGKDLLGARATWPSVFHEVLRFSFPASQTIILIPVIQMTFRKRFYED